MKALELEAYYFFSLSFWYGGGATFSSFSLVWISALGFIDGLSTESLRPLFILKSKNRFFSGQVKHIC